MNQKYHQPVFLTEAIEALKLQPGHWYLDATFGRGGHTQAILQKGSRVVAIDQDQAAADYAQATFPKELASQQLVFIKGNFGNLSKLVSTVSTTNLSSTQFNGILYDLGTSQDQLKDRERGFSFEYLDAPLDMRMDQELGVTAANLLQILSVKQLASSFRKLGGERHANSIAQAIDRYRGADRNRPIKTVGELVAIIQSVSRREGKLHPATKVFQALRIMVNCELDQLQQSLDQVLPNLANQARVVTVAFHQGEDAIIKRTFKAWEQQNLGKNILTKPQRPSLAEIKHNPASRSARLRIFEKY